MANLTVLPPELLLDILSYLPIPSISSLQLTCKAFYTLATENEEVIYRDASLVHGLVPVKAGPTVPTQKLHEHLAQWYSNSSIGEATSWKALCCNRVNLLRSWAGARPSTVVRYHPQSLTLPPNQWFLGTPNQVHRIKVDEKNGFFITTSRTGGLIVSDIESGQTLWNLPKIYVRQHAHLEYENGYMVFDQPDGRKEVWRSESIPLTHPIDDEAAPDAPQNLVSTVMNATFTFVHPPTSKKLSPRFVPHGFIPVPSITLPGLPPIADHTRAYRMVFPHLLAASTTTAYVWDVRTLKSAQTVGNIMSVKMDGPEKNVAGGSFSGRRWWDLLPEDDNEEEDEEVWEDVEEGFDDEEREEEEEAQPLLGQASASATFQAGPEAMYPEVAPRPERLSLGMDSLTANAMDYAQKETFAPPSSSSPVISEAPKTPFPAHPPFASGLFDRCNPFEPKLALASPSLPAIDEYDPLSLSTDAPGSLGFVCYVELSKKWVFVARDEYLTAYKRTNDKDEPFTIKPGQLAMRMPANHERYGRWKVMLGPKSVREDGDSELVKQEVIWEYQPVERNKRKLWTHLVAVHISPDEQHLVLLTGSSKVILIPFFERVIYRQANLYDIAIDIQLGSCTSASIYLAYGCKSNPRIGVVTDTGVFIITPYFNCTSSSLASTTPSSSHDGATREAELTIHRVAPFFSDPDRLELVSCLMMSDTGLWLTWARGAGSDNTPDAERAMYAALLRTRWANEVALFREQDTILDALEDPLSSDNEDEGAVNWAAARVELEARERRGTWQEREDGKYGWKKTKSHAKEEAFDMFEWKFVRGLKTQPMLQARMNGDQQVLVHGNPHNEDESEILWFECSEIHQVKFS